MHLNGRKKERQRERDLITEICAEINEKIKVHAVVDDDDAAAAYEMNQNTVCVCNFFLFKLLFSFYSFIFFI